MSNPRYANGHMRRKYRARFRAMDAPCGICKGRFGPIHYDEPSDHNHPLSFVIDEIKPISRYKEFGYRSKEDAALEQSSSCSLLLQRRQIRQDGHGCNEEDREEFNGFEGLVSQGGEGTPEGPRSASARVSADLPPKGTIPGGCIKI